MSEPTGKAVFLSYASQDAAAAKRICEALRAAGNEVWFDQSELVGGDAWDAKIRKQIADCALFVPVISANTQARGEGYFRLEWKLAVDRSHLMAHDQPFLLPIVIDMTTDAAARVPPEFRVVQWTRLPGGETPEKFCARVKTLLGGHDEGVASRPDSSAPATESGHQAPPATIRRTPSRPWLVPAILGGAAVVALAIWQPWKKSVPATAAVLVAGPSPAQPKSAAPLSEARKLTLQARALIDDDYMAVRESFRLAEELCQRATTLDPSDGEAWATWARVSNQVIAHRYDRSEARQAAARSQAERAIRLAPESVEAGLAVATNAALSRDRPETAHRLRELLLRAPGDKRIVWSLATSLPRDDPERSRLMAEHRALFANDPRPLMQEYQASVRLRRFHEANALLDRAQALAPSEAAFRQKLYLLLTYGEDLAVARAHADKIPGRLMLEDAIASNVARLWIRLGDGEKALEVLQRVPQDFFEDSFQYLPKGFLEGWALHVAHRPSAAAAKWKAALGAVERRLATTPNDPGLLEYLAFLQALTGLKEPAEKSWLLAKELAGPSTSVLRNDPVEFEIAMGRPEEAIRMLIAARSEAANATTERQDLGWVNNLRFNPAYESIRQDPRVQKIIAGGVARLKEAWASDASPPAAAAADQPVPTEKSVAVLAFANLSDDKANEYFSDGISEELLNVLAKVPGLKVSARTSAFHFKGMNTAIPEIAQQLGVAYVVEGSVRKQGTQVRITAQLIKAADGFHVWSDSFTRELKDIFAVQDEIAGLIAKNLSLKLGVSSAASKAEVNPEAFELYLQARQALNLVTTAGFDQAESALNRALTLEPNFARAHAALADVWTQRLRRAGEVDDQSRPDEKAHIMAKITQALTLDPDSAEAHTSLGFLLRVDGKYAEAESASRRAVALNPNNAAARVELARVLFIRAQMDEALEQIKLATELDPLSWNFWSFYGEVLRNAGRMSDGIKALDRSLALRPDFGPTVAFKSFALLGLGRVTEAVALARGMPGEGGTAAGVKIRVFAQAGLKAEAEALLAASRTSGNGSFRREASSLIALGRTEEALALMTSSSSGVHLFDPIFDPVRNDPRWVKLIADAGLAEAHSRAQVWRKAHPPEKPVAK